jgi:hypothetical protein
MSTNAIESTFATVRLRTKKTKGVCSRAPDWPWPTSFSTPPGPLALRQRASPGRARSRWRLARQRGAATAAEQAEAIGQPLDDLLDREHASPDRRQLDRQREAVQPAAD